MIVIDSFLEWLIILFGIFLALCVLLPSIPATIGLLVERIIPDPAKAKHWPIWGRKGRRWR